MLFIYILSHSIPFTRKELSALPFSLLVHSPNVLFFASVLLYSSYILRRRAVVILVFRLNNGKENTQSSHEMNPNGSIEVSRQRTLQCTQWNIISLKIKGEIAHIREGKKQPLKNIAKNGSFSHSSMKFNCTEIQFVCLLTLARPISDVLAIDENFGPNFDKWKSNFQ